MKSLVVFSVVMMLTAGFSVAVVGCNSNASAEADVPDSAGAATDQTQVAASPSSGVGMAAMRKAADADKYLFALFRKEDDAQTGAMRAVLEDVMKEVADNANSVEVDVTDSAERAIVSKFELNRAPMPLILAIAPNGAITGGFPTKAEKRELLDAFASPGTQKCMKQLQKSKLVFLCVQNDQTKLNDEALQGVRAFQEDERFAKATEIIMLDPTDMAEADFLKDLRIDPKTATAMTVFLAPPGQPIATFVGAVTKDQIVAKVASAKSGPCANGQCGPGGCGPKK